MGWKKIDENLFVTMWDAGETSYAIAAAVGLHRTSIYDRAKHMGLTPRPPFWRADRPNGGVKAELKPRPVRTIVKVRAAPVATTNPESEPVYHHGLSDAIKRAGGSVQRLGKVATTYRVPYRDVMEMAGVQV